MGLKSAKDIEGINVAKTETYKVAYVRLSQFGDSTNNDWLAVINKIFLANAKRKKHQGIDFRSSQ